MMTCLACQAQMPSGGQSEYVQCPQCRSFIYISDQPAEIENASYFDATFATLHERKKHPWKRKLFQHYRRIDQQRRYRQYAEYETSRQQIMAHLTGQRKILEIGFGTGGHLAWLLQQGHDAYGLDISAAAVANFQSAYPQYCDRVECGSRFSQPVDAIYCCALFEHLDTPEQFLQDALASLQPRGVVILDGLPLLNEGAADFMPADDINFWKPCHRVIYSLQGIQAVFRKNGFVVENTAWYDDYNYRLLSLHLRNGYHAISALRAPDLQDPRLPGIVEFYFLCQKALTVHSLGYYGVLLCKRANGCQPSPDLA